MVSVKLHSAMRSLAGGESRLAVEGTTVREVLDRMAATHPGLHARLFDEPGALKRFVNVFVEDVDIRHAAGLDTPVSEGQTVSILPAVAGGSQSQSRSW
jgi:sulfur-carrier protein